ncbi:hypothetical protein GGR52DRAFT_554900 [Hypoxylon sp. FL1284]|nr:hypothetical protein GGR52DRAFT_554900 [Hypoxylon sp. FL1284]
MTERHIINAPVLNGSQFRGPVTAEIYLPIPSFSPTPISPSSTTPSLSTTVAEDLSMDDSDNDDHHNDEPVDEAHDPSNTPSVLFICHHIRTVVRLTSDVLMALTTADDLYQLPGAEQVRIALEALRGGLCRLNAEIREEIDRPEPPQKGARVLREVGDLLEPLDENLVELQDSLSHRDDGIFVQFANIIATHIRNDYTTEIESIIDDLSLRGRYKSPRCRLAVR